MWWWTEFGQLVEHRPVQIRAQLDVGCEAGFASRPSSWRLIGSCGLTADDRRGPLVDDARPRSEDIEHGGGTEPINYQSCKYGSHCHLQSGPRTDHLRWELSYSRQ